MKKCESDKKNKVAEMTIKTDKELKTVESMLESLMTSTIESMKISLTEENESLTNEIEHLKKKLEYSFSENTGAAQIHRKECDVATSTELKPSNATEREKKKQEEKTKSLPKVVPSASDDQTIDVGKLDFRIGQIIEVSRHPDADSLYIEQINVGEDKPRTVVSGLVKHMPPEELQGKMVVVLCNLKPAKMRGVTSAAMVMCAANVDKVEVLVPPDGCLPGDLIEFESYKRSPDPVLNPKKKIFEACLPDLMTNSSLIATYKGVPFSVVGKGIVTTKSLGNAQIR